MSTAHRKSVTAVALGLALAAGGVEVARPAAVPERVPASPFASAQWASGTGNTVTDIAATIGATSKVAAGLTGKGVGIALIDTGVVPVPGLPAAQIVNGPDLSVESQAAGLRYLDDYGHGTHMAGIMVGRDPATGLRGIAPDAKLTSIKVGTANGAADVSQVIAALDWLAQHRNDDPANPIKVVCLAYGTDAMPNPANDPLFAAVENATKAGMLVIVAGGNNGSTLGRLNSPSLNYSVVTVGSSATQGTASQLDDTLSGFTSIDPTAPLDVVAPGESVVSLRSPGSYIDSTYPAARVGETLFRGSGSSQATAVVAAAAALLLQKAPGTTPIALKRWMQNYSTVLKGDAAKYTGGELNVEAALKGKASGSTKVTQSSSGTGSLQTSRGSIQVIDDKIALTGEKSMYGPFDAVGWAAASKAGTAWRGGLWMGYRVAGDGWTGTSWASRTWAGAVWPGVNWSSKMWTDSSWSGRAWSGRAWSSTTWSGRYWSSSAWKGNGWSTDSWG